MSLSDSTRLSLNHWAIISGNARVCGAAEIGKHEVILVIDVESIIEEALSKQRVTHHV